jgi:cytochrome P450
LISLGWSTAVGFHTHDERHKKLRRVIASALHPSAARSYAPQHLDSTHDLLRRVVYHPPSFAGSINDIVGAFILRLAYGYDVTKNDPLLSMVHQALSHVDKGLSSYFLVNDFPIREFV